MLYLKSRGLSLVLFFLLMLFSIFIQANPINFKIIYTDQNSGRITYLSDEAGNRIPDFSHAGYKGSDEPLPNLSGLPVVNVTLDGSTPECTVGVDNSACIQKAIDTVGTYTVDAKGFRGIVQLAAETYTVNTELTMPVSGVVLRGTGSGAGDTVLNVTAPLTGSNIVLQAGGNNSATAAWTPTITPATADIVTNYLPVSANSFRIDTNGSYQPQVGDNIIIVAPTSDTWCAAVNYGGVPLPTDPAQDPLWSESTLAPIKYNRLVTAYDPATGGVTLDAPLFNTLDRSLTQAYIYPFNAASEGYQNNIGIENLRIAIATTLGAANAKQGILFYEVEDAWLKDVVVSGYLVGGVNTKSANRLTILNTQVLAAANTEPNYGYAFRMQRESNNILFDSCYVDSAQMGFSGNYFSSGLVVVDSSVEAQARHSEGHQKWTQAMLFDRLILNNPVQKAKTAAGFANRGNYGTSQGWSTVHSVMWSVNVGSDAQITVQKPPTAQNYCMDCLGGWLTGIGYQNYLDNTTNVVVFSGNPGHFEEPNNTSMNNSLDSLFRSQLAERLATGANPPSAPAKLQATYASGSGVTLHWDAVANDAQSYRVERSVDGEESYNYLATVSGGNSSEYVDASGQSNYFYRVAAEKNVNNLVVASAYSNQASSSYVVPAESFDIQARYVKILVKSASDSPVRLHELRVYSKTNLTKNIAKKKPVTASSYYKYKRRPSKAVDGRMRTYWAATVSATESPYIVVDLGSVVTLGKVELGLKSKKHPMEFYIYISNDNKNWTLLNGTTNGDGQNYAAVMAY